MHITLKNESMVEPNLNFSTFPQNLTPHQAGMAQILAPVIPVARGPADEHQAQYCDCQHDGV